MVLSDGLWRDLKLKEKCLTINSYWFIIHLVKEICLKESIFKIFLIRHSYIEISIIKVYENLEIDYFEFMV